MSRKKRTKKKPLRPFYGPVLTVTCRGYLVEGWESWGLTKDEDGNTTGWHRLAKIEHRPLVREGPNADCGELDNTGPYYTEEMKELTIKGKWAEKLFAKDEAESAPDVGVDEPTIAGARGGEGQ